MGGDGKLQCKCGHRIVVGLRRYVKECDSTHERGLLSALIEQRGWLMLYRYEGSDD